MKTYQNHMAAVIAEIRSYSTRLVGNTDTMILITVTMNGTTVTGRCGSIFSKHNEEYTGGNSQIILDAVDDFVKFPMILRVTDEAEKDSSYAGIPSSFPVLAIFGSAAFVGFADDTEAMLFKLGPFGHLVEGMVPD
jgi:hypothetical protein